MSDQCVYGTLPKARAGGRSRVCVQWMDGERRSARGSKKRQRAVPVDVPQLLARTPLHVPFIPAMGIKAANSALSLPVKASPARGRASDYGILGGRVAVTSPATCPQPAATV